jgi:hypothetical protein
MARVYGQTGAAAPATRVARRHAGEGRQSERSRGRIALVDFDGNSIIAFTGVVAGVTWLCAMLPASADEHEIPRVAFPSSML